MTIPLNKLWTHLPPMRRAIAKAMQRVLISGRYILGDEVEGFEREFSDYLGTDGGIGVASGTDALTLALLAGHIGPGDEVLLPAFGPGATISAVLATGATPVAVDVNWDFTLNLHQLANALTPRTKALVAVHLYGTPENMLALNGFAERNGLWLVEDCAQAHGAAIWDENKGCWRKVGTFRDAAAFSFYPTKNLGALGDAGLCIARTPATRERLRALRQYGWRRRDKATVIGRNSRMDEIQAAVLRTGLPHLEEWNQDRRRLSELYATLLKEIPEALARPAARAQATVRSACHLQVLRVSRRNALRRYLRSNGIGTGVHYPLSHSQQGAFRKCCPVHGSLVAERLSREVISLPLHPFLRKQEAERVIDLCKAFWNIQ